MRISFFLTVQQIGCVMAASTHNNLDLPRADPRWDFFSSYLEASTIFNAGDTVFISPAYGDPCAPLLTVFAPATQLFSLKETLKPEQKHKNYSLISGHDELRLKDLTFLLIKALMNDSYLNFKGGSLLPDTCGLPIFSAPFLQWLREGLRRNPFITEELTTFVDPGPVPGLLQ